MSGPSERVPSELADVAAVAAALAEQDYIAERGLATAIFLSLQLGKPLFLEGEAGVGKTEIAKVLASALERPLIRLQCYEGLDASAALYEWNYAAQLLHLRAMEAGGAGTDALQAALFHERFLLERPLLQAIRTAPAPVLLIDEVDRADEEFEAFLLELLSDFQVSIPELGTIRAVAPPIVIITSNRTREIHDALKRRCLYFWIDYPNFQKELTILRRKQPMVEEILARQITSFIQELRRLELFKRPGVAETLDWTAALIALDQQALSLDVVGDTLGVILKYQDDVDQLDDEALQALYARAHLEADRRQVSSEIV